MNAPVNSQRRWQGELEPVARAEAARDSQKVGVVALGAGIAQTFGASAEEVEKQAQCSGMAEGIGNIVVRHRRGCSLHL